MFTAEFWVAVSFFVFTGLLGYLGVHRMILKGLDARGERIAKELEEAKRLREDAAKLLKEYEAKRAAAEGDAAAIVAEAKREADVMRAEAQARLEEMIARRTKQAETKIAMAERDAAAEVRNAAADAAVKAAGVILAKSGSSEEALTKALGEVKARLN